MSLIVVRPVRVGLMVTLALACALLGCSKGDPDDPNTWYNKTIVENLGGGSTSVPDYRLLPPPSADAAVAALAGAVPPMQLYQSESSCGAILPGPGGSAAAVPAAPGDIALGMSECDVARRAGSPDKVELAAAPNGARALTLSYLRSPRPRIYHFTSGHLVAIENLPEPPPPRDKGAARPSR